jgi:hypothetical protein
VRFTRRSNAGRAAVLGCGPAGLFAAHALIQNGWSVDIYARESRPSDLFGCQYLHAPIPGLTDYQDPVTVSYQLEGTAAGYAEKVYGGKSITEVSVDMLLRNHMAWDIRSAYSNAWDRYGHLVQPLEISPEVLGLFHWSQALEPVVPMPAIRMDQYHRVISSIPAPALCHAEHEFVTQDVWAMGDAPIRGQYVPYRPQDNTIICDGTEDRGWYRAANVYGYATMEWPIQSKPPLPGIARVSKPISTNCDCFPRIMRVGRYGQWRKGILSHTAYTQAAQI